MIFCVLQILIGVLEKFTGEMKICDTKSAVRRVCIALVDILSNFVNSDLRFYFELSVFQNIGKCVYNPHNCLIMFSVSNMFL